MIFMNRFIRKLFLGLDAVLGSVLFSFRSKAPICSADSISCDVPVYTYKVVNIYPHDKTAFTQGLVFEDGILYEGTGLAGQSTLRRIELETGNILQIHRLPAQFFGEGITVYGNTIIQLTMQSKVGFVYDKASFEILETFTYQTEGWGITYDGRRLIRSDGTSALHFLDPETFEEIDRLEVFNSRGPVDRINDLQYVRGEIFANIWKTDRIARISPQTGQVIAWVDLKGLLSPKERCTPNDWRRDHDVLNGIAFDAKNDRLFVTGKLWPRLFEIELIPLE